MKKHRLYRLSIIGFLLLMGLVGCSDVTEEKVHEEKTIKPRTVENEFFLFKSTEDNENVDLLLQIPGQEIEKIATNVDYFRYLRESNAYLLCEKKEDLKYQLELQTSDGNKYLICKAAWPESIKVTTDETRLYYLREIDQKGVADLYTYELSRNHENEKEKLVSDIISYDLIPGGIVYVTAENKLYIQKDGQKSQLIATGVIPTISTVRERVFYQIQDEFADSSEAGGRLYYYEYNQEPQEIDIDVVDYQVTDDGEMVFYLNKQAQLFSYRIKDNSQEMIADWLNSFLIEKQGRMLLYKDRDEIVYLKERGQERQRVGFGCSAWAASEGKIIYLSYNKDLLSYTYGKGQEELAIGVKNFVLSPSGNSLAYYTLANELFFQELGKKKIKIADNITDYFKIYLGNSLLFEQNLPYIPKGQINTGEEVEGCIPCQQLQKEDALKKSAEHEEHDEHDECKKPVN